VITSIERDGRWSLGDKQRLVATCFEQNAVISETAHVAGIQKRSDASIELSRGHRLRIYSDIHTDALGRILDCVLGLR
jgi:transposase